MTAIVRAPDSRKQILLRVLGLLRAPDLALWSACMILMPFYVFRSGQPQIADFVSLLVVPALLLTRGMPTIPSFLRSSLKSLYLFSGYAVITNLLWGLLLLDYDVQKVGAIGFAGFYIFNAYIVTMCFLLYAAHGAHFFVVTSWATVAAVLLQLVLLMVVGGAGLWREKLYFNNPNQLGYYALLAASLVAFGYHRGRVPLWLAGSTLAATALFAALSLSKAAILGIVAVALLAAVRRPLLLLFAAAVLLVGVQLSDPTMLVERLTFRIGEMQMNGQGDDSLAARGYSRIEMHPQHLVLGAGEVGHDRHGDFGGELHSSFGMLIFSYGIVGTSIFCVFLWCSLRRLRWRDALFLVPILSYGATHQGLRFRMFWVFMAFVALAAYHARLAPQVRAPRDG